MIVMIDNYDSFTYNIFQQLAERGVELKVIRNDQITLEGLDALGPTHLIVSPGPGNPDEAGISMDAIKHFAGKMLLKQHKIIMDILKPKLDTNEIHAVQIKTIIKE